MKVTFIMPSVGRRMGQRKYIRTWQMEPLPIAALAALTPASVEREFFDDRFDEIDFNTDTDLVAMTTETYTARRAYEISKRFRDRGVKVVMGGFHASMMPEETLRYADAIVRGEAENVWPLLLADAQAGQLKREYRDTARPSLVGIQPDRTIYAGRDYLDIGLIETGRGCPFSCDFCTIAPFYDSSYTSRPVEEVIRDIRSHPRKLYFFVDDNIASNRKRAKELFRALIPLKIKWVSQGSIHMGEDPELLSLMYKSGCVGVLIGFESLDTATLKEMNKEINIKIDRDRAIASIHAAGIKIYATFVFGYDNDTYDAFERTSAFVQKQGFFIAAFNHMVPFPGTPLYRRLLKEGRLLNEEWWLDHRSTFGSVVFQPKHFTPEELTRLSYRFRSEFYSLTSIAKRLTMFRVNWAAPILYLMVNLMSKMDVSGRQGLPMGHGWPIE